MLVIIPRGTPRIWYFLIRGDGFRQEVAPATAINVFQPLLEHGHPWINLVVAFSRVWSALNENHQLRAKIRNSSRGTKTRIPEISKSRSRHAAGELGRLYHVENMPSFENPAERCLWDSVPEDRRICSGDPQGADQAQNTNQPSSPLGRSSRRDDSTVESPSFGRNRVALPPRSSRRDPR